MPFEQTKKASPRARTDPAEPHTLRPLILSAHQHRPRSLSLRHSRYFDIIYIEDSKRGEPMTLRQKVKDQARDRARELLQTPGSSPHQVELAMLFEGFNDVQMRYVKRWMAEGGL
jgi:hypothetical protein